MYIFEAGFAKTLKTVTLHLYACLQEGFFWLNFAVKQYQYLAQVTVGMHINLLNGVSSHRKACNVYVTVVVASMLFILVCFNAKCVIVSELRQSQSQHGR